MLKKNVGFICAPIAKQRIAQINYNASQQNKKIKRNGIKEDKRKEIWRQKNLGIDMQELLTSTSIAILTGNE